MYEDEIWKDIERFETRYEVSNHGRIKSHVVSKRPRCSKGKILKTGCRGLGAHRVVCLTTEDARRITLTVAMLVIQAFGPPKPEDTPKNRHVVRCRDGDLDNLHIDNLYWGIWKRIPKQEKQKNLQISKREGDVYIVSQDTRDLTGEGVTLRQLKKMEDVDKPSIYTIKEEVELFTAAESHLWVKLRSN